MSECVCERETESHRASVTLANISAQLSTGAAALPRELAKYWFKDVRMLTYAVCCKVRTKCSLAD